MIKVIALSDLHGQLIKIEEKADLFLICGDISPLDIQTDKYRMLRWLNREFCNWIKELPYKDHNSKCILIGGNHDFAFEEIYGRKPNRLLRECRGKLIFLDNEEYLFKNPKLKRDLKIFGCPYCRELPGWAYCRPDYQLDRYYDFIPFDTDILMLHDAPDILDGGLSTQLKPYPRNFGNKILGKYVNERKPKYVVFGHIHSSPLKHFVTYAPNCFICNVSILDEDYNLAYKPVSFLI